MSKYIDVDVFIKSFRKAFPRLKAQVDPDLTPKAYAYLRGGKAIIEDLTKFPAADVVPVVRCKDCHLRGREECAMFYRCECGEQHTGETDNDFCSYGEKIGT